jgi:hypothetical protein
MWQAILRLIGIDVGFTSSLNAAGQASTSFAQKVNSSMFSAFTASTLATKGMSMLKSAFSNAMHEAKQFTNLSLRLGIKPSEVMALSNYAKDSGVSMMVLGKAQQQLDKFVAGSDTNKKYKDLKNTLGITAEEMKKFEKGGGVAMAELAKKMQLVNDETEQMEILTKIFGGRGAMQMKQVLEQSPEEIVAGYKSYAASDETIASASRMEGAVSNVSQMIKVAGFELLSAFEPLTGVLTVIAAAVMGIISIAINGVKMIYQALVGTITSGLSYFTSMYQPSADAAWKKYYEAGAAIGKGMEAAGKLAMNGIEMIGASMTNNLKAVDYAYKGILATAERIAEINRESAKKDREYSEWRMNSEEQIEKARIDATEEIEDIEKKYESAKADKVKNQFTDEQKQDIEDAKKKLAMDHAAAGEQEQLVYGGMVDDPNADNSPSTILRNVKTRQILAQALRAEAQRELKKLYVTDYHGKQTQRSKDEIEVFKEGKYGTNWGRGGSVMTGDEMAQTGLGTTKRMDASGKILTTAGMTDEQFKAYQEAEFQEITDRMNARRTAARAELENTPEGIAKQAAATKKLELLKYTVAAQEAEISKKEAAVTAAAIKAAENYDLLNGRQKKTAILAVNEKAAKATTSAMAKALKLTISERASSELENEYAAMEEMHNLKKENPLLIFDKGIEKAKQELKNAEDDKRALDRAEASGMYVSAEERLAMKDKITKAAMGVKSKEFEKEDAMNSFFTASGDSLQAVGGGGNIAAGPIQAIYDIREYARQTAESLIRIERIRAAQGVHESNVVASTSTFGDESTPFSYKP